MAISEDTEIVTAVNPEGVPPQMLGQPNIYKPSDIKRYGTERFLAQVIAFVGVMTKSVRPRENIAYSKL